MQQDYNVHDVQVRQVPIFDARSNPHQVTRVTIFVGEHGPFSEDFGYAQKRADTPDAIQMWQQEVVNRLRAIVPA